MTPFERAAHWHLEHGGDEPLRNVVEAHFLGGYVFNTPTAFLMGRAIRAEWVDEDMEDAWLTDSKPDCWHVWLFAGDLAEALRMIPYPLPYISMHRRGKRRIYLANELISRVNQFTER